MATLLERVKIRLKDEDPAENLLNELIDTTKDRIRLRVGVETFPSALDSIAVEVSVKSYRRLYFEGVSSENADSINTSFVADIIDEYNQELNTWKSNNGDSTERRVVKFI